MPKHLVREQGQVRFEYVASGTEIAIPRPCRPATPASRRVFTFHRPETLERWLKEPVTLRGSAAGNAAAVLTDGLRACQIDAVISARDARWRKTIHARSSRWRPAPARLSPPAPLPPADQARRTRSASSFSSIAPTSAARPRRGVIDQFVTPDTGRKFTELYNVQHLTSNKLDGVSRVTICTIQRLYSILRGEELDEDIDEKSGFEIATADDRPRDSHLQRRRSHRGLRLHRHRRMPSIHLQSLAPGPGIFRRLPHRAHRHAFQADDRLLQPEPGDGVHPRARRGRRRQRRLRGLSHPDTGHRRARRQDRQRFAYGRQTHRETSAPQTLDEDLVYAARELDRSVVVKSQIRTVLGPFRDAPVHRNLSRPHARSEDADLRQGRSHAEDIVASRPGGVRQGQRLRQENHLQGRHAETRRKRYASSSATLAAHRRHGGHDRHRHRHQATGCLLFLRDVRSRVTSSR